MVSETNLDQWVLVQPSEGPTAPMPSRVWVGPVASDGSSAGG